MAVYDLVARNDLAGLRQLGEITEIPGRSILLEAWNHQVCDDVMVYLFQHGANLRELEQTIETDDELNQLAYLALEGDPLDTITTTEDPVHLSQQLDYLLKYEPDTLRELLPELDPKTETSHRLIEQYRYYFAGQMDKLEPVYMLDEKDRHVLLNYPLIYQEIRPLGEGGYGMVTLAHRLPERTAVAVKIFFKEADNTPYDEILDHFDREKYFTEVVNPGPSCRTKYVCYLDGFLIYAWNRVRPVMVFNYLPGLSLYDYFLTTTPTWSDSLSLMTQLVDLVLELNDRGIEHGDYNLKNMIVHQGHLTLIDFGIACHLNSRPYPCDNKYSDPFDILFGFCQVMEKFIGPYRAKCTDLAYCIDQVLGMTYEDVPSYDLSPWYQLVKNKLDRISQRK